MRRATGRPRPTDWGAPRRRPRNRREVVSPDGTTQQQRPAALAARRPRSLSSITRQRAGADAQARDGGEIGLGVRLGLDVVVSGEGQLEVSQEARSRVRPGERLRLRAGDDGQPKARRQPGEASATAQVMTTCA